MAYFYSSSYPEVLDNYQYYQHQYYSNYDSINEDSRYVQYYDTEFTGNAYQHAPNPSLVGYYYSNYYQPEALTSKNAYFHENGDCYYYGEPVSTEYIVSYNTTNGEAEAKTDIYFEEYNPEPFHGGYDINQTYGKPLPPSEEICYPPSKNNVDPIVPSLNVPSEDKKVDKEDEPKQTNGVTPSKVIQDEEVDDDDDFDDDYDDDDVDDDYDDDVDDDYDDDVDDVGGIGGGGNHGDDKGEKQDDFGKEPVMAAPIASLGNAVNEKQDQNVEGEKNDVFDKKSSEGTKKVTFDDEVQGKDHNQNVEGEKNDDIEKKTSKGTKKVTFEDEVQGKDHDQNVGEVIQGEKPSKFDNKEEEKEKEEDHLNDKGKKEDDNGSHQIKRQIPPGYGMETLDLCEGIFGGYFPCLWKKYQRNHNQESGNYEKMSDYDYCCKDTFDYLFGNPNPYGGSMPEKGSYGDPVYSYQRYYPQQSVTEHVDCYGGSSSWVQSSSYYYGNGDYK